MAQKKPRQRQQCCHSLWLQGGLVILSVSAAIWALSPTPSHCPLSLPGLLSRQTGLASCGTQRLIRTNSKIIWPFSLRVDTGLFIPVNAFLTSLGARPALFIFRVFIQGAGPSIIFNAKYTLGHIKYLLIYFSFSAYAHILIWEGKAISELMAQ